MGEKKDSCSRPQEFEIKTLLLYITLIYGGGSFQNDYVVIGSGLAPSHEGPSGPSHDVDRPSAGRPSQLMDGPMERERK